MDVIRIDPLHRRRPLKTEFLSYEARTPYERFLVAQIREVESRLWRIVLPGISAEYLAVEAVVEFLRWGAEEPEA